MALCRALFLLGGLGIAAFPQAQSTSGDVKGTVVDPSGSAISKAKLTISDPDRGISRSTVSDSNGEFNLPLLPPARYKLNVDADGFSSKIVDGVEVRVGDTLSLTVQMSISGVVTEVDVQAVAPAVDTERNQQANTIEPPRIKTCPSIAATTSISPCSLRPRRNLRHGGRHRLPPRADASIRHQLRRRKRARQRLLHRWSRKLHQFRRCRPVGQPGGGAEFQINRNSFRRVRLGLRRHHQHHHQVGHQRLPRQLSSASCGSASIQARNYFDPEKSAFTRGPGRWNVRRAYRQGTGPSSSPPTNDWTGRKPPSSQSSRTRFPSPHLPRANRNLSNFFDVSGVPLLQGLAPVMKTSLTPSNNPFVTNIFTQNSGSFPFSEAVNRLLSQARSPNLRSPEHLFPRGQRHLGTTQNAQFGALMGYNRGRGFDQ